MGQQGVLSRGADRLAEPFGAVEDQGWGEQVGGADEGDAGHGQGVPGDGPGPVVPAAPDQVAGGDP